VHAANASGVIDRVDDDEAAGRAVGSAHDGRRLRDVHDLAALGDEARLGAMARELAGERAPRELAVVRMGELLEAPADQLVAREARDRTEGRVRVDEAEVGYGLVVRENTRSPIARSRSTSTRSSSSSA
jgi:hypothetical protein